VLQQVFLIDAAIRGYHVEIWPNPIEKERLTYARKVGNLHDPLSIAVMKVIDGRNTFVKHVSKRSMYIPSMFRRGWSIMCIADGPR